MEKTTFADDLIAGLNNPQKAFHMPNGSKPHSSAKKQYQSMYTDMRSATRFLLDDEFVDFAMEASMRVDANELLDQYKLFGLPNDVVWIEWNETKRQETIQRVASEIGHKTNIDFDGIAENVGYLCEASPPTAYDGPAWMGTPFIAVEESNRKKICSSPLSIFFAQYNEVEGTGFSERHHRAFLADFIGSNDFTSDDLQLATDAEHNATMDTLGDWWCDDQLKNPSKDVGNSFLEILNHIRIIQGRSIDLFVDIKNTKWTTELAGKLENAGRYMVRGDARFLITVFSMLNYDWIIKETKEATASRQYRYGKFYRGNSHIQISLDLPKLHGIQILPKGFHSMNESNRRQHSVRGHWRFIRKTGKRTWVTPHTRGNAKLGIITKDYKLKHTGA